MPSFSDDDVLDFMVTEAVVAHALEEQASADEQAAKQREKDAWKKGAKTELPG